MLYLPDTNVFIAAMAGRDDAVAELLIRHRPQIGLSVIVLHELMFGAANSRNVEANLQRVHNLKLPVLAFEEPDAWAAAELRSALRRLGTPIGNYDVLIAGQALARDLTLVTNNTREFSRVQGLRVEDWTTPAD